MPLKTPETGCIKSFSVRVQKTGAGAGGRAGHSLRHLLARSLQKRGDHARLPRSSPKGAQRQVNSSFGGPRVGGHVDKRPTRGGPVARRRRKGKNRACEPGRNVVKRPYQAFVATRAPAGKD